MRSTAFCHGSRCCTGSTALFRRIFSELVASPPSATSPFSRASSDTLADPVEEDDEMEGKEEEEEEEEEEEDGVGEGEEVDPRDDDDEEADPSLLLRGMRGEWFFLKKI